MSEENYDRWHPLYYTTQGFPDEVNDAFATILQQKTKVSEWRQQVYREERVAREKARVDRIKGFEIGQLVKFNPNASHHDEDGNYPWGVEHIIGRVTRRNPNTVSVIEVSRRKYNSDVEQTNLAGRRWRMHPGHDDILDE